MHVRVTRVDEFRGGDIQYRDMGSEFDRTTDPAEGMVQLWCRAEPVRSHRYEGRTYTDRAIAGTGYLELDKDGLLRFADVGFPRTDIGAIQAYAGEQFLFNVFIEPDGSHSGPNGGGSVELDEEERRAIDAAVAGWLERHRAFAERQRRFFVERPWMELVGLTVVQALCRLAELGWPTGYRWRDRAYVSDVEINPRGHDMFTREELGLILRLVQTERGAVLASLALARPGEPVARLRTMLDELTRLEGKVMLEQSK